MAMTHPRRYVAFLSYSHHDARWAGWLHRALERYAVPARLVGTAGEFGPVPARLRPVFRDREELASAGDLGARVEQALAASAALIVICSPAAAGSRWVEQEVALFKRLHGAGRIHALIVAGAPHAGDARECFPPALRQMDAAAGEGRAEPIAADVRPEQDGRALARLKLIAGLLGVGLDTLRQREQRRQQRRLLAITAASVAGMALAGFLAITATVARNDAQRRQAQGEGLIEFMLTDLNQRLQAVQRLDALGAVEEKAIQYLGDLPSRDLTDAALASRAQALRQLGDTRMRRQQWPLALDAFKQALRMDGELLARAPDDPQRLFNLSQSQFWIGNVYFETNRYPEAKQAFADYMRYSERLYRDAPDNPAWLMEMSYAHSNLAAVHEALGEPARALRHAALGVAFNRRAVAAAPDDEDYLRELADAYGSQATIQRASGQPRRALASDLAAVRSYRRLVARHPGDMRLAHELAVAIRGEGNTLRRLGRSAQAVDVLADAVRRLAALVGHDPQNRSWAWLHADATHDLVQARLEALRPEAIGVDELATLTALADAVAPLAPAVAAGAQTSPQQALIRMRALATLGYVEVLRGDRRDGLARLDRAWRRLRERQAADPDDPDLLLALAEAGLLRSQAQRRVGMHDRDALVPLRTALQAHPERATDERHTLALARVLLALGQPQQARPVIDRLLAAGYAEPRFLAECRRAGMCLATSVTAETDPGPGRVDPR